MAARGGGYGVAVDGDQLMVARTLASACLLGLSATSAQPSSAGLATCAPLGSRREIQAEHLHPAVICIGNVHVARVVNRYSPRAVELPVAAARPALLLEERTVRGEDLHPVIAPIDHVHVL